MAGAGVVLGRVLTQQWGVNVTPHSYGVTMGDATETTTGWRCLNCGANFGTVRNGRLYVGGIELLDGRVVCAACNHTRRWVRAKCERDERTAAPQTLR